MKTNASHPIGLRPPAASTDGAPPPPTPASLFAAAYPASGFYPLGLGNAARGVAGVSGRSTPPVLGERRFLMGGGIRDDNDAIWRALRATTGKSEPQAVVLLSSKMNAEEARLAEQDWALLEQKLGKKPWFPPLTIDRRERANDPLLVKMIEEADLVLLAGGDQAKHRRCLLEEDGSDTLVGRAVARHPRVAGTSAGAAVMPGQIFGGGATIDYLVDPRRAGDPISRGLDLLPVPLVVDTHTGDRGRPLRMVAALINAIEEARRQGTPVPTRAIGVDENTMLEVDERGMGRVVGEKGVWVVDVEAADVDLSRRLDARGVRLSHLPSGTLVDLQRMKPIIVNGSEHRRPHQIFGALPTMPGIERSRSRDQGAAFPQLVMLLLDSDQDSARGLTSKGEFAVELLKDQQTQVYETPGGLLFTGLRLDVRPR